MDKADIALLTMADAAPTAAPALMAPPEKPVENRWPLLAPFFAATASALSISFWTASDSPLILGMTLRNALPTSAIYETSSHSVSAILRFTLAYLAAALRRATTSLGRTTRYGSSLIPARRYAISQSVSCRSAIASRSGDHDSSG